MSTVAGRAVQQASSALSAWKGGSSRIATSLGATSQGGHGDLLSSQAEHLLYNPEWSDEGEDEEVEKGANEDIQSVYSEASLQQELTRVLHTSESQESIDAWDDDQWGQFSQISETWDAMVDHHGIMLSEDGLTVLSGTLNSRQPVQLSRPSSSETEDSSDETDSEWGFLETSTASTPRNEDTLAAELVGSHWTTWGSRDTTDTSVPLDGVNALLPTSPGPILAKGRKWSSGVLEAETSTERLSSQLSALMLDQSAFRRSLTEEKQRIHQVLAGQSRRIRTLEKKRAEEKKKNAALVKEMQQRSLHLEGLVVDLARECASLADQVMGLREELQQQARQIESRVDEKALPPQEQKHVPLGQRRAISMVSQQRVGKLKKFFGNEPPLLEMMLSRLGYQVGTTGITLCGVTLHWGLAVHWEHFNKQYHAKFQREGVTILELPHITEEQLINMGIPLGPRQRILDEIQKL